MPVLPRRHSLAKSRVGISLPTTSFLELAVRLRTNLLVVRLSKENPGFVTSTDDEIAKLRNYVTAH